MPWMSQGSNLDLRVQPYSIISETNEGVCECTVLFNAPEKFIHIVGTVLATILHTDEAKVTEIANFSFL